MVDSPLINNRKQWFVNQESQNIRLLLAQEEIISTTKENEGLINLHRFHPAHDGNLHIATYVFMLISKDCQLGPNLSLFFSRNNQTSMERGKRLCISPQCLYALREHTAAGAAWAIDFHICMDFALALSGKVILLCDIIVCALQPNVNFPLQSRWRRWYAQHRLLCIAWAMDESSNFNYGEAWQLA